MIVGKNRGTLTIRAEELDQGQKEVVYFAIHGRSLDKKDLFGKSDPFLEFYRLSPSSDPAQSITKQAMVHRSEVIKKTLNPEWKPFEVSVRHLCEGEKHRPFLIQCFDYDNDGG